PPDPGSPDEAITPAILRGNQPDEPRPDLVVCVLDATQLRRHIRFVLRVRRLGLPIVIGLNMSDLARKRGLSIDTRRLSAELGAPVVETVGVRVDGAQPLGSAIDALCEADLRNVERGGVEEGAVVAEADRVRRAAGADRIEPDRASEIIDRVVLHPVVGPILLAVVMFLVFQAVFAWSRPPMEWIKAVVGAIRGPWDRGIRARLS